MQIGILISNKSFEQYTNVDLLESAAKKLNHKTIRLYESKLSFNKYGVQQNGQKIEDIDVIIPRANFTEEPSLHNYTIKLLDKNGFKVINAKHDFAWSKNKIEQTIIFEKFNIPIPEWVITRNSKEALIAAEHIGYPIIIKVAFGTLGKGVFYASDPESFITIADYLSVRDGNPLIIQSFIKEANRKDIRVFILNGKVLAAMERTSGKNDIRANTSNGGTGSPIKLTEEEANLALKTAEKFHLEIAGVDLIRSNKGPLVLEINSNPGFKELQKVTKINIANEIIKFAVHKNKKKPL